MARYDIQPRRDGATLTLHSESKPVSVSEDFDKRRAEEFIRMFCRAAGLPEPWGR